MRASENVIIPDSYTTSAIFHAIRMKPATYKGGHPVVDRYRFPDGHELLQSVCGRKFPLGATIRIDRLNHRLVRPCRKCWPELPELAFVLGGPG